MKLIFIFFQKKYLYNVINDICNSNVEENYA